MNLNHKNILSELLHFHFTHHHGCTTSTSVARDPLQHPTVLVQCCLLLLQAELHSPVSWDKLRVQPKCAWQHVHPLELHFDHHPLHLEHPAPQCTGHPPGTKGLETEVVVANSGLEGHGQMDDHHHLHARVPHLGKLSLNK